MLCRQNFQLKAEKEQIQMPNYWEKLNGKTAFYESLFFKHTQIKCMYV